MENTPSTRRLVAAWKRYQQLKGLTGKALPAGGNALASAKANEESATADLFIEALTYYAQIAADDRKAEREQSVRTDRILGRQNKLMVGLTFAIFAATAVSAWGTWKQGLLADRAMRDMASRSAAK